MRFGDCQKMEGMSSRTLAARLATLELAEMIEKHEYNEYPPRTEYSITAKAEALIPALEAMAEWSSLFLSGRAERAS